MSCPPASTKWSACYVAQKRKISVGDKLAGRHGNKGVVARVLPQEERARPAGRRSPGHCAEHPLGVPRPV